MRGFMGFELIKGFYNMKALEPRGSYIGPEFCEFRLERNLDKRSGGSVEFQEVAGRTIAWTLETEAVLHSLSPSLSIFLPLTSCFITFAHKRGLS